MYHINAQLWQGSVRPADIDTIEKSLMDGGVMGYPTETVYGLGCDAFSASAAERIVTLKGREARKGLLVLIRDIDQVDDIAVDVSKMARRLMQRFWPGPLTLILKASSVLSGYVTGGMGSVGVRISSDPVCHALLEHFDRPLVSTSANPAGKPPAQSAHEVFTYFANDLDLIIDGDERRSQTVSTIVDVRETTPRLLRAGKIDSKEIKNETGDLIET